MSKKMEGGVAAELFPTVDCLLVTLSLSQEFDSSCSNRKDERGKQKEWGDNPKQCTTVAFSPLSTAR